jgi:hypothetical protein
MVKCARAAPACDYPQSIQWCVFREVQRAGDLALAELKLLLPEYSDAQLLGALKRLKGSRHLLSYMQPSRVAPEDPDADCMHWAIEPAVK